MNAFCIAHFRHNKQSITPEPGCTENGLLKKHAKGVSAFECTLVLDAGFTTTSLNLSPMKPSFANLLF